MTGTVIGLTSIIGYLPDFFYSAMFGSWLDKNGNAGYNQIFLFLAATALLGAVIAFLVSRNSKKTAKAGE